MIKTERGFVLYTAPRSGSQVQVSVTQTQTWNRMRKHAWIFARRLIKRIIATRKPETDCARLMAIIHTP